MKPISRSLAIFLAFLSFGAPAAQAGYQNEGSMVGQNFSDLTYYSPEWVFTDCMKQAMPWISQKTNDYIWDTGESVPVDSLGWPILSAGKAAGTLLFRDIDGHYPTGTYHCYYDGEGEIQFSFNAHTVSSSPGHVVMQVTNPNNDGIYLKINSSNPNNRVRNIRLMMPGFDGTAQKFHPLFKQKLAPFKVLRFMDWQKTNMQQIVNWSDRTKENQFTQANETAGVAIEHMIDLCNELGADPWFCMPHKANDAFILEFAKLVKQKLNADRKIYIEHSNEIWNGFFGGPTGQFQYCIDKGVALGYDQGGAGPYLAGLRYHSERSVQIFSIWKSVFGSNDRFVRVLGSQSANPWVGEQIMDWKNAYQQADALAVAPYFSGGLDDNTNVPNMTIQQIVNALYAHINQMDKGEIAQNAGNAKNRGLKLVAYEGGQHLVGAGDNLGVPAVTAKFLSVNLDPAMYGLYKASLDSWKNNGADMFVHFTAWSKWDQSGFWGSMRYQDQPLDQAHKYRALVDWVAENPGGEPQGLHLSSVTPGNAGAVNSLTISNENPASNVYFLVGVQSGMLKVPGCVGSAVGIGANGLVVWAFAPSPSGQTTLSNYVSPAYLGLSVYFQAVQPGNCGVSNLVQETF